MYSQLIVNISVSYNKLFLHAWKINCKEKSKKYLWRSSIIWCFLFALKTTLHSSLYIYSWPLNNAGLRGTNPLCSQKFACIFWLPKNLTTNSLPLIRSLTDNINSRLTHILYMYYILYSYNKAKKWKFHFKKS